MSNPKGLISPDEAKTMNDAYTSRCELISKDILKRPDNRSSWYSLDEIENFLTYAKAQARDLGLEMDGIRIYCGAYPEEKGEMGYSTTFIVPTTSQDKEGGGNSHDIKGANGLNRSTTGFPPGANYPQ